MNERIKQLAEQACFKNQDEESITYFAELIVRECVNHVIDDDNAFDVLKHFGLEERKGWVCPKCGIDRTKDVCPKGHTAAITGDCPMTATAQSGVEE